MIVHTLLTNAASKWLVGGRLPHLSEAISILFHVKVGNSPQSFKLDPRVIERLWPDQRGIIQVGGLGDGVCLIRLHVGVYTTEFDLRSSMVVQIDEE
jgi:hypothetical protein